MILDSQLTGSPADRYRYRYRGVQDDAVAL